MKQKYKNRNEKRNNTINSGWSSLFLIVGWNEASQRANVRQKRHGLERLGKEWSDKNMDSNMNNKWNIGQGGDMPIGFGLSLAANQKSMEAFSAMSDAEKTAVVEKSRQMTSRAEMERFVNSLGKQ